jgi:hypothetical protein
MGNLSRDQAAACARHLGRRRAFQQDGEIIDRQ